MDTLGFVLPSVAAIVVMIVLSAFFSSTESAIFSVTPEWIAEAAGGGGADAVTLERLREDPHRLLVTILIGNNLVNIAITSVATLLVSRFAPPGITVVLATLGTTVVILVFGEIVPKSYGLGHAESWSLRVARPVALIERVLSPLVTLFDGFTRRLAGLVGGDQRIEESLLDE